MGVWVFFTLVSLLVYKLAHFPKKKFMFLKLNKVKSMTIIQPT